MSLIFQQAIRQNGGALELNVGTGAPGDPVRDQGLMFDGDGAIYATTATPPARYSYGLPFDANDRLVVEDGAIDYYSQGIGFTANHAVAVSSASGGVDHYNQGVPYAAGGGFAVNGLIPPVPPNAIVYAMGTDGIEVWRTDVSPYTLDTTLIPSFPGSEASAVAYSQQANLLAIASVGITDAIYFYDTSTTPYTLVETYATPFEVDVLAMAPDGQSLIYGASSGVNNIVALDVSDPSSPVEHVFSSGDFNVGQVVYTQDSQNALWTQIAGAGTGYYVFDTSSLPPTQDFFTSGSYGVAAENSLHGYSMFEFSNLDDLYAFTLSANSFVGTVDSNFNGWSCLTSPNGLFMATQKVSGFQILNTTSSNVTSWSARSIASGDELPSGDMNAANSFGFSNASNLLALFQDSNAGDRRIVFDLNTSPIERVPSFDTEGDKDFRGVVMVGDFT